MRWEDYIWNCRNKVVYGPVVSRRLGWSLGINLFPVSPRVCTFDCLYCDCGGERLSQPGFADTARITRSIERGLAMHRKRGTTIDYITLAGNGEPTAHPAFPEICAFVARMRNNYFPDRPTAVFTNGTMLGNSQVMSAVREFDERIVKLDAGDEATFQMINRPTNGTSLNAVADYAASVPGIKVSSAVICSDVNNAASLRSSAFMSLLRRIRPAEVHLYSIDYPQFGKGIRQARMSSMLSIGRRVADQASVHVRVLQAVRTWRKSP
ncbi:hypothetical protein FJY68_12865 [candidate division WOR-3 bacterium]|uniref:Radical SAM core domain-containing protein n=1 Tax=candidate division WOR-3 bacterium TaxID=2052148 RepID=A0A938BSK6_UNCW3|nr:hypothetical protein [candidate division WOR-3 bacterium]